MRRLAAPHPRGRLAPFGLRCARGACAGDSAPRGLRSAPVNTAQAHLLHCRQCVWVTCCLALVLETVSGRAHAAPDERTGHAVADLCAQGVCACITKIWDRARAAWRSGCLNMGGQLFARLCVPVRAKPLAGAGVGGASELDCSTRAVIHKGLLDVAAVGRQCGLLRRHSRLAGRPASSRESMSPQTLPWHGRARRLRTRRVCEARAVRTGARCARVGWCRDMPGRDRLQSVRVCAASTGYTDRHTLAALLGTCAGL